MFLPTNSLSIVYTFSYQRSNTLSGSTTPGQSGAESDDHEVANPHSPNL